MQWIGEGETKKDEQIELVVGLTQQLLEAQAARGFAGSQKRRNKKKKKKAKNKKANMRKK